MNIRAVIWDLGGVLVRTEDYLPRRKLASRLGMTLYELEYLVFSGESAQSAQLGQISVDQHWENLGLMLKLSLDEMIAFQRDFWGGDSVDLQLVEYIRKIKKDFLTALLSNAFSDLRHVVTEIWKFSDVFNEMIISSEVGEVKPNPRIYLLALRSLNVSPQECVFIDDTLANVEAARRLNILSIQFSDPDQVIANLNKMMGIS